MFKALQDSEISVHLSPPIYHSKHNVTVSVRFEGEVLYFRTKVNCTVNDVCRLEHSRFSKMVWLNPGCYKLWQWFIIILVVILLILLVKIGWSLLRKVTSGFLIYVWPVIRFIMAKIRHLLYWIVYKIKKAYLFSSRPPLYEVKAMKEKVKLISKEVDSFDYKQLVEEQREKIRTQARQGRRQGRIYRPILPTHSVLMTLLLLFTIVESCDVTTTLVVEQSQCTTTESGNNICTITSSARIAVSPIGQTSCFILKLSGKPIGSAIIKTNSVQLSCRKNSLYWAPHLDHSCHSAYNCHKAGWCSGDYRECNNPSSVTKDIFGPQDGEKSWHTCDFVSSGSECLLGSSACLHQLKTLTIKSKDSVEVMDCSSWDFSADLEVFLMGTTTEKSDSINLIAGESKNWESMRMSLVSISVPPSTGFNKCFLKRGSVWAMADCNRRGEYSIGRLGEVQCPTKDSAESTKLGKCIAKPELITNIKKNEFVICNANYLDSSAYFKDILPTTFGAAMVSSVDDVPRMSVKGGSLLELQVDFKKYTITAKSDENLCFAKFVSLSGCYSCTTGAVLSIDVNANFGTATGLITCPEINFNSVVSVTEQSSIKNVSISVNQAHISCKCFIKCPAGEKEFDIQGDLLYVPNTDNSDNSTHSGDEINNGDVDWSFTWKNPFSVVIMVIIAVFIVVILINCFVPLLKLKTN